MEAFRGQRKTEARQPLFFCAAIPGYLRASDLILSVRQKQVLTKTALHSPHISYTRKVILNFLSEDKVAQVGRAGAVESSCCPRSPVLGCTLCLFTHQPSSLGVEFNLARGASLSYSLILHCSKILLTSISGHRLFWTTITSRIGMWLSWLSVRIACTELWG